MIFSYTGTFVDGEELKDWLSSVVKNYFPENTHIAIIPHNWEAKGESRFFCEIEIEEDITIPQLLSKVVTEHSREGCVCFYASDVVQAAVNAKKLVGIHFYLYYKW